MRRSGLKKVRSTAIGTRLHSKIFLQPDRHQQKTSTMAKTPDPDFDLIMDEHLAKNEWPKEKMDKIKGDANHVSLTSQVMNEELFNKLKDVRSRGPAKWSIARAINTGVMHPDSGCGCHAGDHESYEDFKELFHPVIEKYHKGFDIKKDKHASCLDPSKIPTQLSDSAKQKIISTRIRVARNLSMFPLNPGGSLQSRLDIMELMEKVGANFTGVLKGKMYQHTKMTDEERQKLIDDHYLFRGKDRMQAASGYHEHWPQGRGIFVNDDPTKKFLLWINEGDHLRIISMQPGSDVLEVFTRLDEAIKSVIASIQKETGKQDVFMVDPVFGNITCCPTNIGCGMRGSVHILVPKLIKKIGFEAIDKFARENNCQARGSTGEHSEVIDRIDISNLRRIGFPEYELVNDMIKTVNKLSEMEDQA